jgi:hypothetical protein
MAKTFETSPTSTQEEQFTNEELIEQGQAIVEHAIKGRTIELGSTALESIFFYPDVENKAS